MYFVVAVLLNLSWVIFSSFSAQPLFRPPSRSTSLSLILFPSISTFFLVFYILSVSLSIFRSHLHPLLHDFSLFFSHRFRFFLFSSLFSCFHFLSFRHFITFYLPNLPISSSSVFVLSKFPSSYPLNFSPPSSASVSRHPLLIVLTISLPLSSFRLLWFHSSS